MSSTTLDVRARYVNMKPGTNIFHPGRVRNTIKEPQQSWTTHAEAELTTTGEPSQSQTVTDPESGATATNICELRPATKGRKMIATAIGEDLIVWTPRMEIVWEPWLFIQA